MTVIISHYSQMVVIVRQLLQSDGRYS